MLQTRHFLPKPTIFSILIVMIFFLTMEGFLHNYLRPETEQKIYDSQVEKEGILAGVQYLI